MNRFPLKTSLVVAALLWGGAASAVSAQNDPVRFSGQVTLATDSASKLSSETRNKPQAMVYGQVSKGPFYAGVRLKNIKGGDGSDSQQDFALGVKGQVAGFDMDVVGAYKIKPGSVFSDNTYFEWKGTIARTWNRTTASFEIEHSPDPLGPTEESLWLGVNLAQKLNDKWSVSGGVGTYRLKPANNYSGVHLGATYAVAPKTTLDLRYYDTDDHDRGKSHQGRLVLKLSQGF